MTKRPPQPPDRSEVEVGLYVHVAFCQSICYYCDFNTYAGLGSLIPRYVDALALEIDRLPAPLPGAPVLSSRPFRIGSVFFGGGTPSLLSPAQVTAVLASARRWPLVEDAEITLEANPGDLSLDHLGALRDAGVNRLSLGVQSFDDRMLRRLGRRHDSATAMRAFWQAREAGFDNLSIDLMFGLPGQSLEHWCDTLDRALELKPDHLSLYNLTIESGTPFGTWAEAGKLTVPDDDAAADMYQAAIDRLGAESYRQYEISNWARLDRFDYRAQHNLRYWRNQPYFGVGAGAHSSFGGYRYANLRAPREYLTRVETGESPVDSVEKIDRGLAMAETMILGLRLDEGVDVDGFLDRFGCAPADVFPTQLTELTDLGLIATGGRKIRLTLRGRFLGNEVFCRFLS